MIFPPDESDSESRIQVVSGNSFLEDNLSEIFNINIYAQEHEIYDFDLTEISLDTFYEMLATRFEFEIFNLTDIEKT